MDNYQDWDPVVLRKNPQKGAKSAHAQSKGLAAGTHGLERKYAGNAPANARKLDDETETFRHKKISHSFKIALQKARQAKKMTQAQLAQKIGVKQTVINQMEAGKSIPNGQIINKLNRALGVTLPKNK